MKGIKQGTKEAYERGCHVQPLQTFIVQGTETCDWNLMIGRQFNGFVCYREKLLVAFVHSLRDEGWLVGEWWYSGCWNIKQLCVGNDPEDAQGFSFKLVSGSSFPSVFAQWERGIWQWNFFQISSSWEPQSSPHKCLRTGIASTGRRGCCPCDIACRLVQPLCAPQVLQISCLFPVSEQKSCSNLWMW